MKWILRILIAFVLLLIIGGVTFLMTWDIPAPSASVEREIPRDRYTD